VNTQIRKLATPWLLAAGWLALLVLHEASIVRLGFVERLDAAIYDFTLKRSAPRGVDDRITILDIDEASLKAVGRWPWSRDKMAALVDRLYSNYGIAAMGFDVIFAEPDISSGIATLDRLAKKYLAGNSQFLSRYTSLRPALDYDGRFAETLSGKTLALGYYFITPGLPAGAAGALPRPNLPAGVMGASQNNLVEAIGYGGNLKQFQDAAGIAGYFSVLPDADGTMRKLHLLTRYQGGLYESFSAATLRAAMGGDPLAAGVEERKVLGRAYRQPWVEVAGIRLNLNADGSAWVPYRAGAPFPYVSAKDVLAGKTDKGVLENRVVLVGSTAPGLADLRVTPFSSAFPGVEIHAHMIAGMLDGNTGHTPPWGQDAILAITLIAGLLLAISLPLIGPVYGFGLTILLLAGMAGGHYAAWQQHWVLPTAAPLLMVVGLYLLSTAYGFLAETRHKRQITKLFGQYVPPELADEMSRDPTHYSMEGQSREMTVLFSDIRGFTNFSEKLPPTELAEVLNSYLSTMTAIVQKNRGTIDKYIGDAVMAFWNAPLDMPDHAEAAVQTALDMQAALPALNEQFAARNWPHVKIGVGVNSGRMSVGNMGSTFRMSYTVMGDAVNLGSRLEGITKQYGVGILATQTTVDADAKHVFMKIDDVRVKGKEQPVAIYEPLGVKDAIDSPDLDHAQRFEQAFTAYQHQQWDQAETLLTALNTESPRALYDIYLERIAHFRAAPPPEDWDGVFVYTTK
jgi:adenylate cyclase